MMLDNVFCSDTLEFTKQLESESVDCVITSPPYYQLIWKYGFYCLYWIMEKLKNGRFIKGNRYSPGTEFKKGEHYRPRQEWWSKDYLYQKYVVEKFSMPELAKIFGCTTANVKYWLYKHNIKLRSVSEARAIKKWGLSGKSNGMYGKMGGLNPRWLGGITPERQSLYSSIEWKILVQKIFKRDEYKCQRCSHTHTNEIPLHIHHLESFANKEKRTNPENLILLCKLCHNWIHSKKNQNKEYIIEQF